MLSVGMVAITTKIRTCSPRRSNPLATSHTGGSLPESPSRPAWTFATVGRLPFPPISASAHPERAEHYVRTLHRKSKVSGNGASWGAAKVINTKISPRSVNAGYARHESVVDAPHVSQELPSPAFGKQR